MDCVVVKKQLESQQRQLGKALAVKTGAYIMSVNRKTTVYGLETCESRFLKNAHVPAVHSNTFPYFTDLSVSSSLYHHYSSRAGLHSSVCYSASPL